MDDKKELTAYQSLPFYAAPTPPAPPIRMRETRGRKPKYLVEERERIIRKIASDADYALALHVAVMRNEEFDIDTRMSAAQEVMNRAWGKPAVVTRNAGADEFKGYLKKLEALVGGTPVAELGPGDQAPDQGAELSSGPVSTESTATPDSPE